MKNPKKLYHNQGRIGIKINGKQKFMTLYSFLFDDFISFLEKNSEIKQQYDKYNTIDYNNDMETDEEKIKSFYNLLRHKYNRNRFSNKIFHLLIINNEYVASFYTSKELGHVKHVLQRFNYKINNFYEKISIVLVNPKYRRLGIAYKMLNLYLTKGQQKYFLIAEKSNLPAVKLYKKLGFVEKAERILNNYNEILFIKK